MSDFVRKEGGSYVATQRLYLTADRKKVVAAGNPKAAFLFASGEGQVVTEADVKRLGLMPFEKPTKPVEEDPKGKQSEEESSEGDGEDGNGDEAEEEEKPMRDLRKKVRIESA